MTKPPTNSFRFIDLYEGLRVAVAATITGEAAAFADQVLNEGIAVLKWHRRLGGDTRKRMVLQVRCWCFRLWCC